MGVDRAPAAIEAENSRLSGLDSPMQHTFPGPWPPRHPSHPWGRPPVCPARPRPTLRPISLAAARRQARPGGRARTWAAPPRSRALSRGKSMWHWAGQPAAPTRGVFSRVSRPVKPRDSGTLENIVARVVQPNAAWSSPDCGAVCIVGRTPIGANRRIRRIPRLGRSSPEKFSVRRRPERHNSAEHALSPGTNPRRGWVSRHSRPSRRTGSARGRPTWRER